MALGTVIGDDFRPEDRLHDHPLRVHQGKSWETQRQHRRALVVVPDVADHHGADAEIAPRGSADTRGLQTSIDEFPGVTPSRTIRLGLHDRLCKENLSYRVDFRARCSVANAPIDFSSLTETERSM